MDKHSHLPWVNTYEWNGWSTRRLYVEHSKKQTKMFSKGPYSHPFSTSELCTCPSSAIQPRTAKPREAGRAKPALSSHPLLHCLCLETGFCHSPTPSGKQGGSLSDTQMFDSSPINLTNNWSQHYVLKIPWPPFPVVGLYSPWQFPVCLANARKPGLPN